MSTLPDLSEVKSSHVAAVGHRGTDLYVKFHSGAVWKYAGVSPEVHQEMMGSGSVGRYLSQFIKPNHKAEKVS